MKKYILFLGYVICFNPVFCQMDSIVNAQNVFFNKNSKGFVEVKSMKLKAIDKDCLSCITSLLDKNTNDTIFVSKDEIKIVFNLVKGRFEVSMSKSKGIISLSIIDFEEGEICVEKDENIDILFRDGPGFYLKNKYESNCEGKAVAYFGGVFGGEKVLLLLKTKQIETLRLRGHNVFVERNFTQKQSKQLMKTIRCLSEIIE